MNRWEKTLEASNWAAFRFGPQMRKPAFCHRSTMPSASGLSGPTTVRSAWLVLREGQQAGQVFGAEAHALDQVAVLRQAFLGDAGVARRAPHLRDVRRLGEFPDQGVLAPAGADDQNLHGAWIQSVIAMQRQSILHIFLLDFSR